MEGLLQFTGKFWAVVVAVGGLAAVGGVIDACLYKSERKRLIAWLEDCYLRFTDIKWINFGRKEAESAIRICDKWVGSSFWSWKRWRFALIVTVIVYGISLDYGSLHLSGQGTAAHWYLMSVVTNVPISLVTFALSLSVTRWIAMTVAHLASSAFANAILFALLLLIHLFLLTVWSELVRLGQSFAAAVPEAFWRIDSDMTTFDRIVFYLEGDMTRVREEVLPKLKELLADPIHKTVDYLRRDLTDPDVKLDILVNGLRIVFALVFLMFRPIHGFISRLWSTLIRAEQPQKDEPIFIFTSIGSALGILVAVGTVVVGMTRKEGLWGF